MKKIYYLLFAIGFVLGSCSNDESNQEEEHSKLMEMQNELYTLSKNSTEPCTDPSEWAFVKLGDACDGELNIIYSKKINTAEFLKKAKEYRNSHELYFKKFGYDCGNYLIFHGPPSGIKCMNGKPVFIYPNSPSQ